MQNQNIQGTAETDPARGRAELPPGSGPAPALASLAASRAAVGHDFQPLLCARACPDRPAAVEVLISIQMNGARFSFLSCHEVHCQTLKHLW